LKQQLSAEQPLAISELISAAMLNHLKELQHISAWSTAW